MATVVKTAFELRGADAGPLRGEVRAVGHGVGMPAVVISHGFKGFKDWGFFPHIAARLAGAGMTVVTFNFSGSGIGPDGLTFSEPDRFFSNTHSNQVRDLATTVEAVLSGGLVAGLSPPSSLGLLGYSMGGAGSIVLASRRAEVKALVTWSAISKLCRWDAATLDSWRQNGQLDVVNARTGQVLQLGVGFLADIDDNGEKLNPVLAAKRLDKPWLIIHCAGDETVPIAEARELRNASANGQLIELKGGSHTFGAKHPWGGMTEVLGEAFDSTVDHFVSSLL
jgi:uncharacterized protein